jgi:hypothetical protein
MTCAISHFLFRERGDDDAKLATANPIISKQILKVIRLNYLALTSQHASCYNVITKFLDCVLLENFSRNSKYDAKNAKNFKDFLTLISV